MTSYTFYPSKESSSQKEKLHIEFSVVNPLNKLDRCYCLTGMNEHFSTKYTYKPDEVYMKNTKHVHVF